MSIAELLEQRGFKNGEKSGFKNGEKSGFKSGVKSGETKGRLREKLQIVKNMLAKGLDINFINETTGMPIDQIAKLQRR